MDLPGTADLRALMEGRAEPSVSILMPTRRAAVRIDEDQLRLKNLIKEAESRLGARGVRSADARDILEPARAMLSDALFWRRQENGLALFAAPGVFQTHRVPLTLRPLVYVGDRFHTRQLLPMLDAAARFYVLLLQKARIRLLIGSRFTLEEVDLHGAPERLAALLESTIEIAANMHFHSVGHGESAGQTTIVHTSGSPTGGPAQESKQRALEFYEMIAPVLHDYLRDEKAPLILAGVDPLIPLSRQANTYPPVADDDIQHGADHVDERFIHAEALRIAEPLLAEWRVARAAMANDARAAGRMSEDLSDVIDAALVGRVDTLFVSLEADRWGRVGADGAGTVIHDRREDDDDDLLDLAASATMLRGGAVAPMTDLRMRELSLDPPAAALFRY